MAPAAAPPRLGFRSSLERDVYHVLGKLESAGAALATVGAAYDAIKRSNSSLARLKKRPLEDAIDRVLQMRKQEQQRDDESDDSDAALDAAPEPARLADDRLLNRQMTKLWKVDIVASRAAADPPAAKRRRVQADADDQDDAPKAPDAAAATPPHHAATKHDAPHAKKTQKPSRFSVEQVACATPLGGVGDAYRELFEYAWQVLLRPDLYAQRNSRPRSGMLVSGPSGMGKSTMVKNLASQLGVTLVRLDGCFANPERMEKSLAEAFDTAVAVAPAVVFVEDIDRHMSRPGSPGHSDAHRQAVRHFKSQMERLQGGDHVPMLVVATTAHVADVDAEVLGFGLLQRTLQVRIPDRAAREAMMAIMTRALPMAADVDLAALANMTHAFVGADLAAVTEIAEATAVKRQAACPTHTLDDFLATGSSRPGQASIDGAAADGAPAEPQGPEPVTMHDFKAAIAGFTPSLRKDGFTVKPSVTWDHVGAMEGARKQLQMSIIGPIKNPDVYRRFGLRRPAGVLLWGPPGCGKTLVAQAVANEAQASFILINGPELLNKYVGESERAVRELFQRARSSTPCILFFDEIDSIVPPRSSSSTESGARVVNALLAELDGAQDRSGIYVIGTTNRPEMIDEAMLRPGRLSVELLVDLPTPAERVDILRAIYRTNHEDATDAELEALADVALDARCTGFSGADLSGLHTKAAESALEAWMAAACCGDQRIGRADWEHALARTRASVADPSSYRLGARETRGAP